MSNVYVILKHTEKNKSHIEELRMSEETKEV